MSSSSQSRKLSRVPTIPGLVWPSWPPKPDHVVLVKKQRRETPFASPLQNKTSVPLPPPTARIGLRRATFGCVRCVVSLSQLNRMTHRSNYYTWATLTPSSVNHDGKMPISFTWDILLRSSRFLRMGNDSANSLVFSAAATTLSILAEKQAASIPTSRAVFFTGGQKLAIPSDTSAESLGSRWRFRWFLNFWRRCFLKSLCEFEINDVVIQDKGAEYQ